jgi:hypothetical protein
MPFKEIKPLKDFVRIHDKGITISTSLLHYFIDSKLDGLNICKLKRVKIYIDDENSIIGLQPSLEGYKLSSHGGGYIITCVSLSNKLEKKEYFPKWSKKHKMLIFSF